jgi:hypothetical protein
MREKEKPSAAQRNSLFIHFSETSVNFHRNNRRHIPEDSISYNIDCQNFKSIIFNCYLILFDILKINDAKCFYFTRSKSLRLFETFSNVFVRMSEVAE